MSNREDIISNIIEVLEDMDNPKPRLITREPFDVDKLSLQQFPALLVTTGNETREDNSMGGNRRGTLEVTVRAFRSKTQ